MNTVGFKASWHKPERKKRGKKTEDLLPSIIPGTIATHVLEIQVKIDEHEQYILTKAFSRLNKKQKQEILDAYRFLIVTLAAINPNQSGGEGISFYAASEVDIHEGN